MTTEILGETAGDTVTQILNPDAKRKRREGSEGEGRRGEGRGREGKAHSASHDAAQCLLPLGRWMCSYSLLSISNSQSVVLYVQFLKYTLSPPICVGEPQGLSSLSRVPSIAGIMSQILPKPMV